MKRTILIAAVATATIAASSSNAAAQLATPECSPAPINCTAWYASNVMLTWHFAPEVTDAPGCSPRTFRTDGVHAPGCSVSTDGATFTQIPLTIHVDKTAPEVRGVAPSRGADTNGWYRSPVQISFFGTDGTSGIDGCSSGTYSGPDAASAQVVGRCWDRAGNVSGAGTFNLRYDATAPSLANVAVAGRDHKVRLGWGVPDATSLKVWRIGTRNKLVARGASGSMVDRRLRNGHRYRYLVRARDAAGNTATRTLAVVPGPRLFAPAAAAQLSGPPLLRWTKVGGADYYNVQLFRGRRKILSVWPEKPRLQLHNTWRYGGKKRRLKPGKRYRWFVWPGEGARSDSDYGRLIGARTFVITP